MKKLTEDDKVGKKRNNQPSMGEWQRQAAAGANSKWTVAGYGHSNGEVGSNKSVDPYNVLSGRQTTK